MTTTLLTLFDRHRDRLLQSLGTEPEPAKVVTETRLFLDSLRFQYLEEARPDSAQQRLLPYLMDLLKASLATLACADRSQVWQADTPASAPMLQRSVHLLRSEKLWWRAGQWLGVMLLLGLLWTGGEWTGLLLLGLLLASLGKGAGWLDGWQLLKTAPATAKTEVRIGVNLSAYLARLGDSLLTLDKVLGETAALARTPATDAEGLEQYPALLDFYQDMLEARLGNDARLALRKAQALPILLEEQGLNLVNFDGNNSAWFEFLPSLDPSEHSYRTLSPALLKGSRLLCRGRVIEPENAP